MRYFDAGKIEGTRCYCDARAAEEIRRKIAGIPLSETCFWGSGDYHYITLFRLERITEPFRLVLFDNHTDCQQGAFGDGILSCGNWVLSARRLPMMKELTYIGKPSWRGDLPDGLPLYISVDLDVLSPEFARTNWDQGSMTLDELCGIMSGIVSGRRVIGMDFCGAEQGDGADSLNRTAMNQISKAAL